MRYIFNIIWIEKNSRCTETSTSRPFTSTPICQIFAVNCDCRWNLAFHIRQIGRMKYMLKLTNIILASTLLNSAPDAKC